MNKPVILVTGANGQLGMEFRELEKKFISYQFIFVTKEQLPRQDMVLVNIFFKKYKPSFCINCAAYTAVDKAESDKEMAFLVNATATGILALACEQFNSKLIHISTDYVFDGQSPVPYKEEDNTNPINEYGASKLKGEELCLTNNPGAIIIRTAWVYSAYGNNFLKTMLRLMKDRSAINVVSDQLGAPTYGGDLAAAIMHIIKEGKWVSGVYHYSNTGKISWYDFAEAIKELSSSACQVNPIPAEQYPAPAKRPSFSLLNSTKIQHTFSISIPEWKESLKNCFLQLSMLQ
ncbi:MAG: dTDP-4-dehydrorhamnose reductase [Chitinophagaceae bacterium]